MSGEQWWKTEAAKLSRLTYITKHSLRAFRKQHPRAVVADILGNLARGKIVSKDLALAIAGRKKKKTTSIYVLAPDRRGMFVIEPDNSLVETFSRPHTMVTYLRFSLIQEEFVIKHWGEGSEAFVAYYEPEDLVESEIPGLLEKKAPPPEEEEGEEWYQKSGLSLYRLEIEPGLLKIFGNKTAFKRAVRRSVSLGVDVDMDRWRVKRKLEDPETGASYLLQYRPGSSNSAKASIITE